MPGLVGIIRSGVKEEIKMYIDFLIGSVIHESWQKSYIEYDNNYGFGKVDLEEVFIPLISEKDVIIGFYGYAVAYKDFKTGTQKEINIDKSSEILPRKIIEAYRLNKLDIFIPSINGQFSFFIYDNQKNKLIIGNDRYGLRPIYYRKISDGIVFSSELNGLVEIKQKISDLKNTINKEAIVEYFTFQHLLGTKTMIKEICLLPPASILTYMNKEISINNYWIPKFDENNFNLSEKEVIEELDQRLRRAVQRRIPKSEKLIGLTLSGGLDSRCILALLCQVNVT